MALRRAVLIPSLVLILLLVACGGNGNGPGDGGGGGGTIRDYLLATDSTQNNVVVLNLRSDGTIGSTVGGPFSAGAAPSASVLNTLDGVVYVANAGSNSISAFAVNDDGSLTKITNDVSSGGVKPVALGISAGGNFLAVLNQQSFNVAIFSIASGGALSPVTSASTDPIEAPVALAIDPLGEFMFVTSASTVQLFDLNANNGDVSFVETLLTFDQQTINSPIFSPNGRFLYVAGSEGGVYGFQVFDDGSVEQLGSTPVSAGTLTSNLVLDSTGTLMYATDSAGGKIYGFLVSTTTGALSDVTGSPFTAAAGASVMAFDPTENFLHVVQDGTINSYSIAQSGALSKLSGSYDGGEITSLLTYEVQN